MKNILFLTLFTAFVLPDARAQSKWTPENTKTFGLGYVDQLHSEILKEDRTLNIYLPDDYDPKKQYPVIYLLDGAADEDFIHVVGLVQYNTFSWVGRIPQSVVVGIANTNRRRDFTAPSNRESDKKLIPVNGGSEKFMTFLEKELQPFIEKKYSTTADKTIIGQSLGGLLATEILFTRPSLFNTYIIISPSLWWKDGALLSSRPEVLKAGYAIPTKIYIGVGKEGSMDGSENHIMENDARLLADKLKEGQSGKLKVYFDYLPEEDHGTAGHPALFNAFRLLYPKK